MQLPSRSIRAYTASLFDICLKASRDRKPAENYADAANYLLRKKGLKWLFAKWIDPVYAMLHMKQNKIE